MTQSFRAIPGGLTNFPTTPVVKTLTLGFKDVVPTIDEGTSGDPDSGYIAFSVSGAVRVSAFITGGFDGVDSPVFGPSGTFHSWPMIEVTSSGVRLAHLPQTFVAPTPDGPQQPYSGWVIVEFIDAGGRDLDFTINPFDYPFDAL